MTSLVEYYQFPAYPRYEEMYVYAQRSWLPETNAHYHPYVEFSYVLAGSGMQVINGLEYPLVSGRASLALPHHVHSKSPRNGRDGDQFTCSFDVSILTSGFTSELYQHLCQVGSRYPSSVVIDPGDRPRMEAAISGLLDEFERGKTFGRSTMIHAKIVEVVLLFLRPACRLDGGPSVLIPRENQLFWSLLQYVHTNYVNGISLGSVAKRFGVSAPYVSQLFKKHTGVSFLKHLHQLRVVSAEGMLASTDASVSDVAIATGFESHRTFARVFREFTGESPSDYRERRQAVGRRDGAQN